jgi:hypothetical protein
MITKLQKISFIGITFIFTICPAIFADCPPSYPVDCGNGYCCPLSRPICLYGPDEGYCAPSGGCPLSLLLNGDDTKLDVLRKTRDTKKTSTALGKFLISLYYKHADELSEILLSDEVLFDKVTEVANEIAEKALSLNNNEEVSMDQEFLNSILEIADAISANANPALKKTIKQLKNVIIKRGAIEQLGIKITE